MNALKKFLFELTSQVNIIGVGNTEEEARQWIVNNYHYMGKKALFPEWHRLPCLGEV